MDSTTYESVRYEGYGPAGTALIVEALTDNRNRTAAEVRAAFNKYGGNLGETNSVTFMFDRIGLIQYPATVASNEEMFEAALEAGATDVESGSEIHEIQCESDDLSTVRDNLAAKFGDAEIARLSWQPKNLVHVEEEQATSIFKLIDTLEDNDDVQLISANYDVSDEVLNKISLT